MNKKEKLSCFNEHYSTTKNLMRDYSKAISELLPKLSRKGEGGLRAKGYYKTTSLNKPLMSVVTITFNCADVLERTIQSVIEQTYDNIEYIIVDGDSTDGTLEVIKKYEDRINYWVSEPDRGISDAFNKGIGLVSGEWVNFLNAGDYFLSANIVKEIMTIASRLEHYVRIITGFAVSQNFRIPPRILSNDMSIFKRAMLSHQGTFFRKELFDKYGGFGKRYGVRMDYELMIRMLRKESFKFIDKDICFYKSGGISRRRELEGAWEGLEIESKYTGNPITIWQRIFVFFIYSINALLQLNPITNRVRRKLVREAKNILWPFL